MHVYHYAPYEPTAFKRLMGRHATRARELDRMLRAELFVDLLAVVKQGLRASVESYSIKKLEEFYGFTREADLRDAGAARRAVEFALQTGDLAALTPEVKRLVALYNEEDCVSALRLRDWLEALRPDIPRPPRKDGDESGRAGAAQHGRPGRDGRAPEGRARRRRPSARTSSTPAGSSPTCSSSTAARTRSRGGSSTGCATSPTKTTSSTSARSIAGLKF